jgi:hypothetical protein
VGASITVFNLGAEEETKNQRKANGGKQKAAYEEMLSILDNELAFFDSQETKISKDLSLLES